jgi:phosphohistidine phosphatase SixA
MLARLLLTLMLLISAPAHADEAAAWAALGEGGQIALMRHAVTVPGIGDPPGFRLGDCATQRLLSDTGREQAKAIGAALRERGVSADRVLSSAWCRCVDTAELMDVGPVEIFEPLNSFFNSGDAEHEQTEALRELVRDWEGPGTLVLVTHQVNITALTGVVPAAGEIVVLRPDGHVVGRISPVFP